MKLDIDHLGWLVGDSVIKVPTQRTSGLKSDGPLGIVWHATTAGPGGPTHGMALARRIAKLPTDLERSSSWHLLITKAGQLIQSAPFTRGTWHAGGATAHSVTIKGKTYRPNQALVGVEVENAGKCITVAGEHYCEPYYVKGTKQPNPKLRIDSWRYWATANPAKGWDLYTDEQVEAARAFVAAFRLAYGAGTLECGYLHSELDPTRRSDPGPIWAGHLHDSILAPA